MKRTLWAVVLAALAIQCVYADTIRIGAILPLTGNNAVIGEPMRDGILLRLKELEKEGLKNNYEVFFEDAAFDGTSITLALQRQVNYNRVNALISFGGPSGKIIKPIAAQKHIYHMGFSGDPVGAADGVYNFNYNNRPEVYAALLAKHFQQSKIMRPYLLTMRAPSPVAFSKAINDEFAKAEITIAGESFVNPEERDFRTIIFKALESKPDIFIIHLNSPEIEIALRQIQQLAPKTQTTSIIFFDDIADVALIEGSTYLSLGYLTPAFKQKLDENKITSGSYITEAYDMLNILVNAFEAKANGKAATPSDYILSLKNAPMAVSTATTIPGGVIEPTPFFVTVKDGKRILSK